MGRSKAYRDSFVAAHVSNTVASQIARLRTEKGWTQKQLADKADMRQSRISALEDPNYENYEVATLRRIASAYDVGLIVRFVPFSEIAHWAGNLTDATLAVPSFENDTLAFPQNQLQRSIQLSLRSPHPFSPILMELKPGIDNPELNFVENMRLASTGGQHVQ